MIDVLLSSRFKSFYWRTLMMAVAALVSFLAANIGLFSLTAGQTAVIGLILGELSKALNNYITDRPLGFAR